jgi:hypothetical protein
VVVKVNKDAPKTISTILAKIKPALSKPISVMVINSHLSKTAPSVLKNICNTADKITKNNIAFILLRTFKKGTLAKIVANEEEDTDE